jgi:hypothetical protein
MLTIVTMTRTIVCIDSKITDYQQLANALTKGAEVHLLEGERDGILQIQDYLKGRICFDSIHILSHGNAGTLLLGSTSLNSSNLPDYAEVWKQIGKSLVSGGDLLFYGCNVAQGDLGAAFIDTLASYAGADVAASNDLSGTAVLGGNWRLEARTGAIEAMPAFNPAAQEGFASVLLVDDFADNITTTGQVAIGGSVAGNIDLANDADWFKVDLVAGTRYVFDLSGLASGGGTLGTNDGTPYLQLYDPQGSGLEYSFGGGSGDDPRLSFTPTLTDTYFLAASELGDDRTGSYTLKASLAESPDDFADNTTTTGQVAIGGSVAGNIDLANDSDWFKVDLVAGTRYVFDLSGLGSGGGTLGTNDGTPTLRMHNPQGSFLDLSIGGGPGDDPRLSFTPTLTDTYFLEASELGDDRTGTYTLKASLAGSNPPPPPTPVNDGAASFSISGTPAVGNTLVASVGSADPDGNGVITYSWQSSTDGTSWSPVGSNSPSYLVASVDQGKQLRLVVSYTDGEGFPEAVTTAAGSIPLVNDGTASFSISGDPAVGNILVASVGSADPDGNGVFSYSWQTSTDGTSWSPVGSNSSAYLVASVDQGKQLRLVVSYTDGQDFPEAVTTAAGSIPFVNDDYSITLVVDTTVDENDGSATIGMGLSLRDAIAIANQRPSIAYVIKLKSGATYELTHVNDTTTGDRILSTRGKITIEADGTGLASVVNNGNPIPNHHSNWVFGNYPSSELNLNSLYISNKAGGGILNSGTATITNNTITGNTIDSNGGGIYNIGTATITNNTITGNTSASFGGGIYNSAWGTATITNNTITGNTSFYGGGISNGGTATITNNTIRANTSVWEGGGIYNSGTATITNNTIMGNTTSSPSSSGGGGINNSGTATITNNTITSNTSALFGGGIYNNVWGTATITSNTITGNTSVYGGGGGIANFGTAALIDNTITGNNSTDGGGIYSSRGTAILTNNTIMGNTSFNEGGGIYNYNGTATLTNNVITGNASTYGGGIYNSTFGKAALTNNTIMGNTSSNEGGGIYNSFVSTAILMSKYHHGQYFF